MLLLLLCCSGTSTRFVDRDTLSPAVITWGVIMIMRHYLRGCRIDRTPGDDSGGRLGF